MDGHKCKTAIHSGVLPICRDPLGGSPATVILFHATVGVIELGCARSAPRVSQNGGGEIKHAFEDHSGAAVQKACSC